MKIAYLSHEGDPQGGFPTHVENNIKGFKELGFTVDFFFLGYSASNKKSTMLKKRDSILAGDYKKSGKLLEPIIGIGTGELIDPENGWVMPITPYKKLSDKIKLKESLETYDVVIWHTPFWFKTSSVLMDTDWPMLLDLKNPVKIGFIHDANVRSNGAWQLNIVKYFDYIINVHFASYNSCSVLPVKRTLIFNPQDLSKVDTKVSNFDKIKETGIVFSLQAWKGSKHVDDLIRAVKYFNKDISTWVYGDGIESRYMYGSKQKMKPKYFCRVEDDPGMPPKYEGLTIVEGAETHPLYYRGFWVSEESRDVILENSAFFIDTAWYSINRDIGSHFSRTLIEAIMKGVVPIARNLGLSNNDDGIGELFKPNENYIMIPFDATPQQFAKIVNDSFGISKESYNRIVKNNYDLLFKYFDRNNIIKQYVDVMLGKPTGFYNRFEIGKPTIDIIDRADKQWYGTGDKRTFNFKK